jgi:transketolase
MKNAQITSVDLASKIRQLVLRLCYEKKASHIGGAFSIADVLAVLYSDILKVDPDDPADPNRDRLFYSKGHACTALYAALQHKGFFKELDLLANFTADGSYFTSHVNHKLPGVELSTGSLGHALGVACGVALAAKRKAQAHGVFAILSDGELDEGSNWEAFLFAPNYKLDNLVAIVDYNKIQSFGRVEEVLSLEPLAQKFQAFNWEVMEVDGHDHQALRIALRDAREDRNGKPKVLIAHKVKGKGVSFM